MTDEVVDLTPPVEDAKPKRSRKKAAVVEGEAAPVAEKPKTNRRKLSGTYPEDAPISVLVDGNPKKAGSRAAEIFEFYRTSNTVADFFLATAEYTDKNGKKAPGTYGDITYDVGHGFIKVG